MQNTKEILTKISKKKLVLKEFITARERNEIRDSMFEFTDENGKLDQSKRSEYERLLVRAIALSYDGMEGEKLYEKLLDADPREYDNVVAEVNNILTGFLAQGESPKDGAVTSPDKESK